MAYEVKYAEGAVKDLDKIFDFVSNVSVEAAKNLVGKIRSKVNNLSFMPSGFNFDDRLGQRLHDDFKTEAIIVGDYLILFVVNEEDKEVVVTHFISSKSDYMRLLKK